MAFRSSYYGDFIQEHVTLLEFHNEQSEPILCDGYEEPKTVARQETWQIFGSEESRSSQKSLHDHCSTHETETQWKGCKDCIPWPDELPWGLRADKPFKSAFSTKFPNVKNGKSDKNLAVFENTTKFEDVQPLSRPTVQHGIDQHATSSSTFQLEDIGARKEAVGQEEVNSSPGVPTHLGQGVHVAKGSNKGSSGYGTASHPQSTLLNSQYPSPVKKSEVVQEPAEVVTEDSAENVVVSHRGQAIAESLMQQDNCLVHIPAAAIPDSAHKTALVLGRSNSKPVIKTLREYIKTKTELNLKPSVFLANLHLQDVLKLKELTNIPSYLVKRSRLEYVFKQLPPASEPASLDEEKAEAVVSSLKWLEKEQTDALKKTLVSNRRKGWNDLKDSIRAVDMVFLPTLVSKLGISIQFTAEPALSEFVGILDELSLVHRNWGLRNITKSQVVHALFVSSASPELQDDILLEDLPEEVSCVTISKVRKYANLYGETKEGYERFLAVILDDVSHKRDQIPLKLLPALPRSASSVTHCLAVWLAVRAESPSNAVTWKELVEMTRNVRLDESIIVREQGLVIATSSLKPLNYGYTNSAGGTTAFVPPVTAATYNRGHRACAHLSFPSYDVHDFAIAHYPNNPEPNQVDRTQMMIAKKCDAVSLLKKMKGRKDYMGSKFSMPAYLELLRLQRLCPNSFYSDMPLYFMKRVQLEKIYQECSSLDTKHTNGVVCSFIEQVWGDSEEITHFKQSSELHPKAGWNNLKKSPRIVDMNLDRLSYKLGLRRPPLCTDAYMDNFDAIIDEVCIFLQEGFVSMPLKMGNFVEALYFSGADVLFIDELIFQGESLSDLKSLAQHILKNGIWEQIFSKVQTQLLKDKPKVPLKYGNSLDNVMLWLKLSCTGAHGSIPLGDLVEILEKTGISEEHLEKLWETVDETSTSSTRSTVKTDGNWDKHSQSVSEEASHTRRNLQHQLATDLPHQQNRKNTNIPHSTPQAEVNCYATVGTNKECHAATDLVLPLCCQEHSICSISPFRPYGRKHLQSEEASESFSSPSYGIENPSVDLDSREPPVGEELADGNPPVQGHSSLPGNKKAGPSLGPEPPKQAPIGTTGKYASTGPQQSDNTTAVEQTDGSPSNESKHLSMSESHYGGEPARPDRHISPTVQNDIHLKPSEEHPLSSRFELSSTSSNLAVQNSSTSSSHSFPRAESSHNRASEEQLLSRKRDPGNPESVMAHAKAVYLTGDYNRTREILKHFNHHLIVEGKMLRAKLFGLGITHYRQKHYSQAVQHLDELEKVAVEHHAAGDVMLSNIYRGECHLAMEKYQGAYDMFNKAKTVYSTDHVAHLYGIVILSKTSIVIKAATCQEHLRNIIAAEDLLQKALEMAVVARKAAEGRSPSYLVLSDALKPLYDDEIAARTSLGNLHQNMSNCPKAVEEYKLALQLQKKLDSKCTTYGWAEGNLGNALVGAHKVKEAIPHLERAYEAAKKYQRDYRAVGRTASNLGGAYQSNKQYKEAEEYFEIALGHAVYCRDAIGQARSLGNIGNVKSAQGKHMDALRCYTETLSLDCDITANIAAYQNRANVYIDLARELAGGNDWDEVSSDVEAVQPKEVLSSEIPIQECTQVHGTGNMRLQLVAPEGSYIKLPLDDEQDILSNEQSLPMSSSGSVRRTGFIQQQPLTAFDALGPDDLKVRHRKYYLQKAKDDLEKSTKLIEERFNTIKGEGTTSMALSLFEVNAKGFYNLQKVLTLLGDHQGALQVAEQNRARNLGEILWKKKQDYRLQHRDLPFPIGLKNIRNFVNRERVPVVILSYIQQSSTMLVHIVFPEEVGSLRKGLPGGFPSGQSGMLVPSSYISEMSFSRNAVDILSTHQSEESEPFRIPSSSYCFMKIDLPKEYFIAKRYGSLARLVDEEPIAFDQYVQKTLMDYLNRKDVELFTPIDFRDNKSPLTILFERFARRFVEEIEQRWPKGREFVVVADQTAHFLPWPLLQDESTKVFLGDRYRVRTYPSLLAMGLMNHQGVEVIELPSQDRFLIIGNPTIPKFRHKGNNITLDHLPHAETEAVQVAHILEASPLLREMATKPVVEYRLQTAQIIHVATHASAAGGYLAFASSKPIVNTAKPIDSKDALLFIDDIQKLRINASLVVLSAFDSARGQLMNEGVNSIARAFLAAGAQSVLVSLVRVPDKSASIFMSLFYRFLTHNEFTTSEAIQKSSMVIRCIKSLSQHIHWGGYRLVGRDIRMKYNEECEAAKVAKLLGETSAFPRMKILQELEKAIFRQDRTPPRDAVVVKGMMAYDPAEVVKDFVAKRFKLFPGGVFWYNCNTPELLEASVQSILPHSQTIRKVPPKQTKVPENKKRSLNSSPLFEEHYRLIILDNPYSFEECVREIEDINDQEVDIIVIGSMEADRDSSLTKFAHSELIRGCTSVEVEDIDRYTSIQRMAYQLLCKQDFCPYEEDYEAFETIVRFCRGCTSLVKVFEGLLATNEKGIVQKVARDIEAMKDIVIEYDDEHTTSSLPPLLSSHRPMSTFASLSSAIKETGRKGGSHEEKPKESKKTELLVKNGLITADMAKRLSEDDCVLLSEGLEKLPRIMDSMNNLLTVQLTPESHFILQSLSFISQFSFPSKDSLSESSFCFPEDFATTLATLVAPASRAGSPKELVEELKRKNLLRPYPQLVLYPLEKTSSKSSSLLYIPDVVVKSVTYEMDDADFAFAFNTLSVANHQVNGPGVHSNFIYQPVSSAIDSLKGEFGFAANSLANSFVNNQLHVPQISTNTSNKHYSANIGEKNRINNE